MLFGIIGLLSDINKILIQWGTCNITNTVTDLMLPIAYTNTTWVGIVTTEHSTFSNDASWCPSVNINLKTVSSAGVTRVARYIEFTSFITRYIAIGY